VEPLTCDDLLAHVAGDGLLELVHRVEHGRAGRRRVAQRRLGDRDVVLDPGDLVARRPLRGDLLGAKRQVGLLVDPDRQRDARVSR
jgi:hypothetical protein